MITLKPKDCGLGHSFKEAQCRSMQFSIVAPDVVPQSSSILFSELNDGYVLRDGGFVC
jgi:hypothetical protein